MLTIELAVDPLLRGVLCGGTRGESNGLMDGCDSEGVDVPEARLSIDFRGLAEDISIGCETAESNGYRADLGESLSTHDRGQLFSAGEAVQSHRLLPISFRHYRNLINIVNMRETKISTVQYAAETCARTAGVVNCLEENTQSALIE